MTHNVGRRDSALRIAVGFVLAPTSVLVTAAVWIQVALDVVAGFALMTGIVRFCPLRLAWHQLDGAGCASGENRTP